MPGAYYHKHSIVLYALPIETINQAISSSNKKNQPPTTAGNLLNVL